MNSIMNYLRRIFGSLFRIIITKLAEWRRIDEEHNVFEIIRSEFYYINFFLLRIFFRLDEYEKHRIPLTYQRFKYAIFITLNGWLGITILTIYVHSKESQIITGHEHFEKIWHLQRADLVFICVLGMLYIGEIIFIGILFKVLKYESSWHDLVNRIFHSNNQNLTSNNLRYLKKYHSLLKITGIIVSVIVIPSLIMIHVLGISIAVWVYFKNGITSIQLIFSLILILSMGFHAEWLNTALLIATISTAFCTEYLKLRSKQSLKILQGYHCKKQISTIKWNYFHREYVDIYKQTGLIDKTLSFASYNLELDSKISSMTACVFYSRQITMGITNSIIFGAMISVFVYITGIYSQLTYLPEYNHQCCQLLLKWMAKQSIKSKTKISKQLIYASIKSNLFLQTMSRNKFGFHCGHLFFITKFKVVELIMMNIPLILLFYKKILMK